MAGEVNLRARRRFPPTQGLSCSDVDENRSTAIRFKMNDSGGGGGGANRGGERKTRTEWKMPTVINVNAIKFTTKKDLAGLVRWSSPAVKLSGRERVVEDG